MSIAKPIIFDDYAKFKSIVIFSMPETMLRKPPIFNKAQIMPSDISESQLNQIKKLLLNGNKTEATRLYREITRAGIFEAKDAIAEMESHLNISIERKQNRQNNFSSDMDSFSSTEKKPVFDEIADIRLLCLKGEKLAAIQLYHRRKGVSLEEAARKIEALMPSDNAAISPNFYSQTNETLDELILSNQKAHAIKMYAEQNMLSMPEAKMAIDVREAELKATGTEKFIDKEGNDQAITPGKGFIVSMVVLLVFLFMWYLNALS